MVGNIQECRMQLSMLECDLASGSNLRGKNKSHRISNENKCSCLIESRKIYFNINLEITLSPPKINLELEECRL